MLEPFCYHIKGALCSFGEEKFKTQHFNICNINEVIIQIRNIQFLRNGINKLFSEDNKVPEHWKLERWQGPPPLNKVKQYRPWKQREFICL